MGKRVVILEAAEFELVAAVRWYEAQRPGLGAEFRSRVDEAIRRLTESPVAASPVAGVPAEIGARKVFVERFPYAIIFITHSEDTWVLAFAHHHRRPGYWRRRKPSSQ